MWIIFDCLDPDSESVSGSTDLIESGSGTLVFPSQGKHSPPPLLEKIIRVTLPFCKYSLSLTAHLDINVVQAESGEKAGLASLGMSSLVRPQLVADGFREPALQVLLDGAVQGEAHLLQQEVHLHAHMLQPVFRIRGIRIRRIRMFLGLPDPDPLVRDTDPDPSIIKQI